MAPELQIEPNRNKAESSTGPKTPAGKPVTSRNALKHGLLASDHLSYQRDGEKLRNKTLMAVFSVTPDDENTLDRALIQR